MHTRAVVAVVALIALGLAGCTAHAPVATTSAKAPASATGTGTPQRTARPTGSAPALQHVVVIVDENKPLLSVLGSAQAPYLTGLAKTYASATRYSAVAHPSLPNYLAITSGTTAGITSDCNPPGGSCLDTGRNLTQEIDRSGRTWTMYAESMPAPCSTANTGLYAVKHNPFLYFPSVTGDAAYCAEHDVPYSRFATDLRSAPTLPNFSFISPNLCHDMHDCSIATGDAWLRANVPRILASPAFTTQRSLLVVTFDEGDSSDNTVACVFAGSAARPHTVSSQPFTHYSLLRTIEVEWGLPPLTGNDARAAVMTALLR